MSNYEKDILFRNHSQFSFGFYHMSTQHKGLCGELTNRFSLLIGDHSFGAVHDEEGDLQHLSQLDHQAGVAFDVHQVVRRVCVIKNSPVVGRRDDEVIPTTGEFLKLENAFFAFDDFASVIWSPICRFLLNSSKSCGLSRWAGTAASVAPWSVSSAASGRVLFAAPLRRWAVARADRLPPETGLPAPVADARTPGPSDR